MHVWLVKRIHALSVMSVGGVRGCHRFMYCALIAPVPQAWCCLSRVLLTKIESPRFHFIRFRCCFSLHYIRSASFVYRLAFTRFSFFFFRVVLVVSVSVRV